MKFPKRYFFAFLAVALLVSCSQKQQPSSPPSKEGFVGNWKLEDPRGNVYYMTLEADGSGKTTREGGEFGKWEFKQDHIEAEWIPKNLKLYFDPGQAKPLLKNSPEERTFSIGSKIDKIPE